MENNYHTEAVNKSELQTAFNARSILLQSLERTLQELLRVGRANNKNINSKFPAFWEPNYDWTPDQTHGGVLMKALQSMLMRTDGKKIYLLPAFPKDWNANFKLHAPFNTTIQGTVRDNKIVELKVEPEYRRNDIVIVPR